MSLPTDDARLRLRFQKDRMLRRLLVPDPRAQQAAVEQVTGDLRAVVEGEDGRQLELLLSEYLPMCVRLAATAPFAAIRLPFSDLLDHISRAVPSVIPMVDDLQRAALRASHFVPSPDASAPSEPSESAPDATRSRGTTPERVADNEDEELAALFRAIFLRTGRVTHLAQVLAWHKRYLALFDQCVSVIMQRVDGGTLPLPWRNFLALMAASELRCDYVARLQQDMFLVNGGDLDWLDGLLWAPPKLGRLRELSSLLAHQPWLVTELHVAELLRGVRRHRSSSVDTPSECSTSSDVVGPSDDASDLGGDENDEAGGAGGACWSLAELMNAIMVLSHFHATSIIALGVGCAEEVDVDDAYGRSDGGSETAEQHQDDAEEERFFSRAVDTGGGAAAAVSVETQLERELQSEHLVKEKASRRELGHAAGSARGEDDDSQNGEEQEESDVAPEDAGDCGTAAPREPSRPGQVAAAKTTADDAHKTLWRFCGGSVLRYEDFDVRSDAYKVLHTEDFSWDEHCFSLVRRYFPGEAGQILEDLFNLISKLTYDFFGARQEAEVDTSPYRDAVWFYVHRLFGICHDDYDYRQVNEYLDRPTKLFLKKVACTPWKVRRRDFEHFDRALSNSEKCHVVLIVAEARKQAGLMFALRAVMNYMR